MGTPTPAAQTAAQQPDQYLALMHKRFPNYNSWTAADMPQLMDEDLQVILGDAGFKAPGREAYIPQSFKDKYGDNAPFEFIHAALQEASRRDKPGLFLEDALLINAKNAAHLPIDGNRVMNMSSRAPINTSDGMHYATPPAMLNYEIAQSITAQMALNEAARKNGTYSPATKIIVDVPDAAIAGIVNANKNVSLNGFAGHHFTFPVADEAAYLSGYATSQGVSKDVGSANMTFPPKAICQVSAKSAEIFDPKKPDIDVALAWAAGYIQSDFDKKSPAEQAALIAVCPAPVNKPATETAASR